MVAQRPKILAWKNWRRKIYYDLQGWSRTVVGQVGDGILLENQSEFKSERISKHCFKTDFFPEPNLRWFLSVDGDYQARRQMSGHTTVARPDFCPRAHYFCVFCRLTQLFFIEIKCSALNLKYLSQYLNGFGCPLLVPLNFQNLIFGLLYSYWHIIIIIAPLFPTLKLFFVKTYIWPTVFFS